jgi:glucokinase
MILAGDIGGTHSRMALVREEDGRLHILREHVYLSQKQSGLEEIVCHFLKQKPSVHVRSACLGIAGPVFNGRAQASNLPWIADAEQISRDAGIGTVWLINDLEAHAFAIHDLESANLVSLNSVESREGHSALIAAGTGLGETGAYWDGTTHRIFAGEGGHADYAPRTAEEVGLHQYLRLKFGRVSWERVLSGPGIKNIYDFLRDEKLEEVPEWLSQEIASAADAPPVITKNALEGKARICEHALDIFVASYGAEAGNLALRMLATGGVYLSGGIATKILPRLLRPGFMEAFVDKGRMKPLLETIPVKVITDGNVGLIGAARYALAHEAATRRPRRRKVAS